jgi:hypothetical protein
MLSHGGQVRLARNWRLVTPARKGHPATGHGGQPQTKSNLIRRHARAVNSKISGELRRERVLELSQKPSAELDGFCLKNGQEARLPRLRAMPDKVAGKSLPSQQRIPLWLRESTWRNLAIIQKSFRITTSCRPKVFRIIIWRNFWGIRRRQGKRREKLEERTRRVFGVNESGLAARD